MALLFLDSCGDHLAAADILQKYVSGTVGGTGAGLHGLAYTGCNVRAGLVFNDSIAYAGASFKFVSSLGFTLFTVYDAISTGQCFVQVQADGSIGAWRVGAAPGTFICLSAPDIIQVGVWQRIEAYIKVGATTGAIEIRVDTVTVASATNVDTRQIFGVYTGTLRSIDIGSISMQSPTAALVDDVIVMDEVDNGDTFNTWQGAIEIVVKRPNGEGASTQWTPSPPPTNWANVDDVTPDGDATYNEAGAGPLDDLFEMEDLAPDETVTGVQLLVSARRTIDGPGVINGLMQQGATLTVTADVATGATYNYLRVPFGKAPSGALWSKAIWDAIQCGVRKAS